MSLVGPRPCIPYETEHFAPHHFERFLVPAGITGPLAGDGARAFDVRRGARHGRRVRARLVARPRPQAAPAARRFSCCARGRRHDGRPPMAPRTTPVRVAVVGLGYWGPNLVRNLHELAERRARRASATCGPRRARAIGAPLPGRRARRRASTTCSPTETIEAVAIATPVSTHYALARAALAGRQARLRREAARRLGRARRDELDRARRASAASSLMPGHTFLYSPPVNMIRELIRVRRARRHLLHLDEPREPRAAPAGRQRRLGSRPARLLDPALLARRDAVARRGARAAAASSRHPRRRLHQPRVRVAARSRTSSSPGSRRASCAGRRSSAREKMVVYDDTSTRAGARLRLRRRRSPDPETFGEYQLTYRTGDIVSPRVDAGGAALARAGRLLRRDPHRRSAALVRRSSGSTSSG